MYPLAEPIEYLPERDTSVFAQAEKEGRDAEEWLYDYFLQNDGHSLVYIPAANFSECIPELLQHPFTVPALGDGGAHVGTICDASANVYVLTKWVKERAAFSLEQAIHLLTRKPAELYSLYDRGILAVGMKADINIIDFDRLALRTPHICHDLPAGGRRLLQNADGISATIVSGEVIYEEGIATGALPGKLVRGQQRSPAQQ
jgi:N-acyl-D-aspartate/D-glutamate deacylase